MRGRGRENSARPASMAGRRQPMQLGAAGERLCRALKPEIIDSWFHGSRIETQEGDLVRVVLPTKIMADHVRRHFEGHLLSAFAVDGIKRVEIVARQAVAA